MIQEAAPKSVSVVRPSPEVFERGAGRAKRGQVMQSIVCALAILSLAALSLYQQSPPRVVPASASSELFSASSAMKDLANIARRPHPIGSAEHGLVRDYLVKEISAAGLEAQIQRTTAVNATDQPLKIGAVENVLGRLKGSGGAKAVLLVSHYDSMPNSLGASDDGAGVAALLETLRVLKASPPLKNDIVFLFSDGEETGLLGARAFVAEHPWAKDVGVVFNFEARGTAGPSLMFETSEDNGWLVREFARAVPFPFANSASYEMYRFLPNDTDLTVFKSAHLPGLNFAYVDGLEHYHTPLDNSSNIDARSLQHHGSYALALARHFGNLDLGPTSAGNATYFDLFGRFLVYYPMAWALPLAVVAVVLFLALLALGFGKGQLDVRGTLLGFLALLFSGAISMLLASLLWKVAQLISSQAGAKPASQGSLFLFSFVTLAVAITAATYGWLSRRMRLESLAAGAMGWWAILTFATAFFLPGTSFLFVWPLCFGAIAAGLRILRPQNEKRSRPFVLWFSLASCTVPAIILMAPIIYQMFLGLSLDWTYLFVAMVVLLLGLLIPNLQLMVVRVRWVLPAIALIAIVSFVAGNVVYLQGARHPLQDNVFYGYSATTGKGVWASDAPRPDEWTSQFVSNKPERAALPEFGPAKSLWKYLKHDAPAVSLPAPELKLVKDETADGIRTLQMRLTSPRHAETMIVYLDSKAEVLSASADQKPIESEQDRGAASIARKQAWGVRIYAFPTQGLDLQLRLKTAEPLTIRLVDQSNGLPELSGVAIRPRPPHLIPSTASSTDSTFVSKSFVF